ncbi:hypothetical protein [Streptomyces microflavus]|uniref:hypothetical protein n=1 Tax=Streptomyces microflavus TaxID=1919 RepID=UPI0033CC190B
MTNTPMTPDMALARLRHYGESTSTWSTATYNDGREKALHQIAVSLAAEVELLRARPVEAHVLRGTAFALEDDHPDAAAVVLELANQAERAAAARPWTTGGDQQAKDAPRDLRPGACDACGAIPDEWCPDCAACHQGCHGGHDNNPCAHPNACWNTEPTS